MIEYKAEFSDSVLLEQVRAALPGGVPAYLVGGAVRDLLLLRPVHDLDFVLFHPNVLEISRQIANRIGAAYYPLDRERDTARLVLISEGGSRQTLDFSPPRAQDLSGDLSARDFTINAMAIDLRESFTLVDPMGGASDLHAKALRACSNSTFTDDPVRILRAVRQAVEFGLHIIPSTRALLHEAIHLLPKVTVERKRDELFRILGGRQPEIALRTLDVLGVLPQFLPELYTLKGVRQSLPHTCDVWEHTLNVVSKLTGVLKVLQLEYDPVYASNWAFGLISLRLGRYRQQIAEHMANALTTDRSRRSLLLFAAMYHDSGKPACAHEDQNGRVRFLEHELVSEGLVSQRARGLRLSNDETHLLELIVRYHMRPLFLTQTGKAPSRRAIYRFFRDCGPAGVDICLLSVADVLGTYGVSLPQDVWSAHLDVVRALLETYWENEERVSPPRLIGAGELIQAFDLTPGPLIGKLMEALREAQAVGRVQDRDSALEFAEIWLGENQ